MSIAARCADCGKGYKVGDQWAGKRIRCKACGGVVAVPSAAGVAPTSASKGAPRKSQSRTPAAPSSDDPFGDLDSLMELEQGGAVQDAPPPPAPARRPKSAPPPPPAAPARARRAATVDHDGHAPAYTPRDGNAYVTIPAEDMVDKWLPIVCVGIFVAFMLVLGKRTIGETTELGQSLGASDEAIGKAVRKIIGYFAGFTASPFVVLAPLCLLGVYVGSRIMKFTLPPLAYWRCAAVACTPFALSISLNQFDAGKSLLSAGWWLGTPVTIGVLWLLFRLKPVPFAVTAPLAAATMLGIPYLLASVLGYVRPTSSADRWRDHPRRTDPPPKLAIPTPGNTPRPRPDWPPKPPPGSLPSPENLEEQRTRTRNALGAVGTALRVYANKNNGVFPPSLVALKAANLLEDRDLRNSRGIGWYYMWFAGLGPNSPAKIVVAHDSFMLPDNTRAVLYADGTVEFLDIARYTHALGETGRLRREVMAAPKPK